MTALEVTDLSAGHGALQVLHGVGFRVAAGEILAVLGRNGAGRSTLLRALVGLVPAQGAVRLQGNPIEHLPTHLRARAGLAYVPETRDVFPTLTVEQNLQLGGGGRQKRAHTDAIWTSEHLLERFPALALRRGLPAAALSGGEQQMLTLSRSLLLQPQVLLVDEPTEGLSPAMTAAVQTLLKDVARAGCAVVLVEQKLTMALDIAERCLVLGRGDVVFDGPTRALTDTSAPVREWLET